MVLRGGNFGRKLGPEVGALMMELVFFQKTKESLKKPGRGSHQNLTNHAGTLISGSQPPKR